MVKIDMKLINNSIEQIELIVQSRIVDKTVDEDILKPLRDGIQSLNRLIRTVNRSLYPKRFFLIVRNLAINYQIVSFCISLEYYDDKENKSVFSRSSPNGEYTYFTKEDIAFISKDISKEEKVNFIFKQESDETNDLCETKIVPFSEVLNHICQFQKPERKISTSFQGVKD